MKLLFFEFATASGIKDPLIASEGLAMLEGLISDFQGIDAHYLISNHFNWLNFRIKGSNLKSIAIEDSLFNWLDENIHNFDECLFIAPEEDNVLYKLTSLIENKGVNVIGSDSKAVKICSDKYKTYILLKDNVPIIKTEKILFDEVSNYKKFNNLFFLNYKKVIKPVDGVSCSGVHVVNSYDQFKRCAGLIRTTIPYFVMQDYIEGTSCSVSLLSDGEKAVPLSLNAQNININQGFVYNGGYVPLDHELSQQAKDMAKKTVESIPGLKGYVGVDLILGDSIYVVEINSRITTPYIALRKILNFNLGKAIINSVNGSLPETIYLDGRVCFEKKGNYLEIYEGSFNGNGF
ncbi:MAG: ATP-grasp domain-containing protein [Methanobacteriaceae archaeon]|nr:ATP-grasp domain-containing protein [Methanobacteriaceae archaeon]